MGPRSERTSSLRDSVAEMPTDLAAGVYDYAVVGAGRFQRDAAVQIVSEDFLGGAVQGITESCATGGEGVKLVSRAESKDCLGGARSPPGRPYE